MTNKTKHHHALAHRSRQTANQRTEKAKAPRFPRRNILVAAPCGAMTQAVTLEEAKGPRPGFESYPFHSFQVPLQQTVQREGDYVVHILNLKNKNKEEILTPFAF